MAAPSVVVEFGAVPPSASSFRLDHDSINGGQVLGADTWGGYSVMPDADLREVHIRRGGTRRECDAGEVVIEINDRLRQYDPELAGSYYSQNGRSLIRRGMLVRVRIAGEIVFAGRLISSRTARNPFQHVTTWIAEDDLGWLGRQSVAPVGGGWHAGNSHDYAVELLTQESKLRQFASCNVSAGGGEVVRPESRRTSIREALQLVANGEGGRFFCTRANQVTLLWNEEEPVSTLSSAVVLGADAFPVLEVTASQRLSSVVNRAVVERPLGDPDVIRDNDESVADYGQRSVRVPTLLKDYFYAAAVANYYATASPEPARGFDSVRFLLNAWDEAAVEAWTASTDIGTLVTVDAYSTGARDKCVIDAIAYDCADGGVWCTVRLSPFSAYTRTANLFTLNSSSLNGSDVIAYF